MPALRIDRAGQKVRLASYPSQPPGDLTKAEAARRLHQLDLELFELQDLMFGARTHSLLVVLQGRDTAGKDGTIKNVVGAFNPRGVHVVSFGVPSTQELSHDFLWRIHREAPARGEVAIFNRSHYEDVLVVRVHGLAPAAIWRERYEQINAFEQTLGAAGTIVIKFFLHISPKEQENRLLAREEEAAKAWKLNVNDWKERPHWQDYTRAYEDALSRCSSPEAPWYVVPADKKWYRNLVVAEAICERLRPLRKAWRRQLATVGAAARKEIEAYRAG